jgi:hypothetical protein
MTRPFVRAPGLATLAVSLSAGQARAGLISRGAAEWILSLQSPTDA